MTTQTARYEIVSSTASERNFQTISEFVPASSAKAPVIIRLFANKDPEKISPSFSGFSELLSAIENNVDEAKKLGDARKWVGENFYAEGPTLASLRLAAGLSQKKLAELCGIDQPHVSRYESGKHEPSISLANGLATALGVSLDDFYIAWKNSTAEHRES